MRTLPAMPQPHSATQLNDEQQRAHLYQTLHKTNAIFRELDSVMPREASISEVLAVWNWANELTTQVIRRVINDVSNHRTPSLE